MERTPNMRKLLMILSVMAVMLTVWNCGGGGVTGPSLQAYVLHNPGLLGKVNLLNGSQVGSNVNLTGNIREIATRPTDGQLYGLGSDLKLYSINATTGACIAISASALAIDGYNGGFDFEGASTIRFTSVNKHNYRINVSDGTLAGTDTDADIQVVGLAYNFENGDTFACTAGTDALYKSTNAAGGAYSLIGNFSVNLSGDVGFAFDPITGQGYVVANEGLYRVNVSNGSMVQLNNTSYDAIAMIRSFGI